MDKKLLVITYAVPQELEVSEIREEINEQKKSWLDTKLNRFERFLAKLNKRQFEKETILVETGIGKVNAYKNLSKILNGAVRYLGPNVKISVVNLGTAASINAHIGDMVECNRFVDRDLITIDYGDKREHTIYLKDNIPSLLSSIETTPSLTDYYDHERYSCNSGDTFVTDPEKAYQMRDGWTAVCDMEGFAQAKAVIDASRGLANPIEFLSVKYITDKIGEDNTVEGWEEELPAARMMLTVVARDTIQEFYSEK